MLFYCRLSWLMFLHNTSEHIWRIGSYCRHDTRGEGDEAYLKWSLKIPFLAGEFLVELEQLVFFFCLDNVNHLGYFNETKIFSTYFPYEQAYKFDNNCWLFPINSVQRKMTFLQVTCFLTFYEWVCPVLFLGKLMFAKLSDYPGKKFSSYLSWCVLRTLWSVHYASIVRHQGRTMKDITFDPNATRYCA